MRPKNLTLEKEILDATLKLLETKEPVEIGMRDVAKMCNVSATSIYHYFKDKNELFKKISITCLAGLRDRMEADVSKTDDCKEKVRFALESFRDWCFENPTVAIAVLSKFSENIGDTELPAFYVCNKFGLELFEECVRKKIAVSKNPKLDTEIMIAGLWGCIQISLSKRNDPEFWNRGKDFTDCFIEKMMNIFFQNVER